MSIKFACDCGKAYKVPEKYSGKRIKCKKCGEAIRVPSESQKGVVSQRTSAVSKRSVINSSRLAGSGRSSKSSSSAKPSKSSKSGRSSRESRRSGRSARTSAKTKAKKSKPGSDTERFTPVDLTEGNALKSYKKKKQEEFKRGEGRLTYFESGKPKKAFRLAKTDLTIGRDEGCTVSLPVASISREHLKVEYKLGTYIATDLQSSNGLVVNGRNVRRCSLRDGDVIQIGEAILRVDVG